MVASLVDAWLGGAEAIVVRDEASVALVRNAVRDRGAEVGLARNDTEALVTAASELGHNQLRHAGGGFTAVRVVDRGGLPCVEVIAADEGGGILDPSRALEGGLGPRAGLGVGLAGARRLADELDIDVRIGEGTCVVARKLSGQGPRFEVAIVGRAHPHERVSGDDAAWVHGPRGLLLLVADGLGHGPAAREASERLAALVRGHGANESIEEILDRADPAVIDTRGAVASFVTIDPAEAVHVGVGNVSTHLYSGGGGRRFVSSSRVLGRSGRRTRALVERARMTDDAVVVMFTDGLSSRADVSGDVALLRRPALVIAHAMLERFGRDNDDALVLVARVREASA
jgi:anti-sigma regulatory factor (Ser/Thr protein kinase)